MTAEDATERDHHFFSVLGLAVEAARLGRLQVRFELTDGSSVAGVPAESALVSEAGDVELDHSGARADVTLGETVVMLERVRWFAVERPQPGADA